MVRFRNRFMRKGKSKAGTLASIKAVVFSSWLNLFLVIMPLAWYSHFENAAANHHEPPEEPGWPYPLTFALCFLAILPLEHLFEYGGEQMTFYVGKDLGDLLVVTLNNVVEATLAIVLLTKCELKLLQSTIIGVVILHLLLIPGTAFVAGGARVVHQDLHPHLSQLNHTLLAIGVMALLLPTAFFASVQGVEQTTVEESVNDASRLVFLQMSRGLAIIMLLVYFCSRVYLHNPPGDDNALNLNKARDAPNGLKHEEEEFEKRDPEVSQWVCLGMLAIAIALMAATAEWLVDSMEFVREEGRVKEEWFGLILLPLISFSADGVLAAMFFFRYLARHYLGHPSPPSTVAKARAIDLSIQFLLFWMPFLILLAWWINKPLTLLFDIFEVALIIAAMFLVNYVTADAKTNWAEGVSLVAFYAMIACVSWFYTGQVAIHDMHQCTSLAAFFAGGGAAEGAAEGH
ncbi:hypothetical protein CYLTODRAFT_345788 [Cylindrobasidium torrendii FP15055 ss-10]|uniref:Sodium/calcium exchanger membrane region domain-containing protein n=1 Tax=Cylindrobasidium torrendii FP15055 ss-10 TaxID=1314674 RepID=A0A0D7BLX4_9AGAR|nr:hypothetical protein CYLTODRAFT_345788 [Cylindrobasidium torrendii FP15055 ss-10]